MVPPARHFPALESAVRPRLAGCNKLTIVPEPPERVRCLTYIYIIYIMPMLFQYDPAKAAANVRKHGVSFGDAEGVLNDPLARTIEDPDVLGERRFVAIGLGNAGELLVVIYTERGGEYRLISARRATQKERKTYEA